MRYFREVKLHIILLLNLILGLLSGRFMYQAVRFLLGWYAHDGIFWRVLGVQYATLIFIFVFFINQFVWKKKRTPMPRTDADRARLYFRLVLTVAAYTIGALLINLIFELL